VWSGLGIRPERKEDAEDKREKRSPFGSHRPRRLHALADEAQSMHSQKSLDAIWVPILRKLTVRQLAATHQMLGPRERKSRPFKLVTLLLSLKEIVEAAIAAGVSLDAMARIVPAIPRAK
jgi:hypothetical protein